MTRNTALRLADTGLDDDTTTTTYEVIESRPVPSGDHINQVAVAGRSNHGIHLTLTEEAALVLAKVLIQYESAVGLQQLPCAVDDYDPSMWAHLSIDLLAARAMNLSASTFDHEVVYATMIAGRAPDLSRDVVFAQTLAGFRDGSER